MIYRLHKKNYRLYIPPIVFEGRGVNDSHAN
jgi:hypothetical protein